MKIANKQSREPHRHANSPTAICQNVVFPSLKLVASANRVEDVPAGLESKMVCVI